MRKRSAGFASKNSTSSLSLFHPFQIIRIETFQKSQSRTGLEFRVRCFDTEKKTVPRSPREFWHIEYRVIGLGKTAERQSSNESKQRAAEDRQLKRNRDVHRPAIQWTPADIHGPVH